MRLSKMVEQYPDEASCALKLRQIREKEGIECPKCGSLPHYWKKDKQSWECKQCHRRTSLTSGTIMHKTKIPLRYWFIAIGHMTSQEETVPIQEMQRQLGHKRYEPIWAMIHKIRTVISQEDDSYQLAELMEMDHEMFASTGAQNIDHTAHEPSVEADRIEEG